MVDELCQAVVAAGKYWDGAYGRYERAKPGTPEEKGAATAADNASRRYMDAVERLREWGRWGGHGTRAL